MSLNAVIPSPLQLLTIVPDGLLNMGRTRLRTFYLIHNTIADVTAPTKGSQFHLKNDTIANEFQCNVADFRKFLAANKYNFILPKFQIYT